MTTGALGRIDLRHLKQHRRQLRAPPLVTALDSWVMCRAWLWQTALSSTGAHCELLIFADPLLHFCFSISVFSLTCPKLCLQEAPQGLSGATLPRPMTCTPCQMFCVCPRGAAVWEWHHPGPTPQLGPGVSSTRNSSCSVHPRLTVKNSK